jgi:hypothetical protein
MSDPPKPPVPPDCDLRGMEWLPLYGGRLFGSDFDAHATDAEFRAGLQLWWSAWNQVPAASLPDDDVALCRLAGLGRQLKAWNRVKIRALHGFFICSDGRFYHRALSTFALESWARRLKDRERKARWREQRERKNPESDGDTTRDGTSPSPSPDASRDADSGRDGTADAMRRDATRRDSKEEPFGSSERPRSPKPAGSLVDIAPQNVVDAWNQVAQQVNAELGRAEWPLVRDISPKRRKKILTTLKTHGADKIKLALERAASDRWARNETKRRPGYEAWRFNFDHFITEDVINKFAEQPVDDGQRRPTNGSGLQTFAEGAMSAAGKPLKGILER